MLLKRKHQPVQQVSQTDTKSTANAQQNDTKPHSNDTQTAPTTVECKRIVKFVGACEASVTQREISGGTGIQFDVVRELLPALVESGALRVVEGEQSFAHYRLASFTPAPPAPKEPYIHPDVKWSNEQRARELAKDAVNRPKPMPRYEPSDSAVDAALREKATVRPLTDAERKELAASRDRLEINPNMFLR